MSEISGSNCELEEIEPIAIVGVGCRFPGGASNSKAFWKMLCQGKDAIVDIPKDRWDVRRFYDSNPDKPGKTHVKRGGFLKEKINQFDPMCFGISPREAEEMDPQQRLLLEVTWEAFEDAGIPLEKLKASRTGVYVGGFCLDNLLNKLNHGARTQLVPNSAAGVMMTILANRISHAFDLRGPSVSMDTACSSSLVAAHYACQGLWNNECDAALFGGVNVMFRPEYPILMSKGKFLSDHGYCKSFDADAGGYTRGEGAGIVVLKRLSDAKRDRDNICALIRMTGVNQDGHTAGISLPNPDAQQELVSNVYARGGVAPSKIQYVEAHGTGTQAGDPAEISALNAVLSENRNGEKCLVGSVKSNIGHLEAAAGVAGLIKAALIVKNRTVPPNLHFNNPNPKIPFDKICLEVPTSTQKLESKDKVYAGVNSFGYGGTNAHVLLEEYLESETESQLQVSHQDSERDRIVVPLSAQSKRALDDLVQKCAFRLIANTDDMTLADVAYTTVHRRSHHSHRLALVARSIEDLKERLQDYASGEVSPEIVYGQTSGSNAPLVFVYSGMGPQWWAMGRELFQTEPVFRDVWQEVDDAFKSLAGWSITDALGESEEASRVAETQVAQPANFALQAALTALWKSWGIEPDAIIGHSVGEVAAAYAAGVLSLEDAIRVSYYRSKCQQTCAGKGTMLAVGLSETEATQWIGQTREVSIAALNSPGAVTLAGTQEALQEIANSLEKEAIFNRFLKVEVAYHSYQMDEIEAGILNELAAVTPREHSIDLYSSVTGQLLAGESWGADYWWKNVRQPVRFADGVSQLLADGYRNFLEVGPHPVLSSSIRECSLGQDTSVDVFQTLNRKAPENPTMLESLGVLYTNGVPVNWDGVNAGAVEAGKFVSLPTYPWQRELCWKESLQSKQDRLGNVDGDSSPYVYFNHDLNLPGREWEVEFNDQFFPFIYDHKVGGRTVFPGAGYVDAGLCLHHLLFDQKSCVLADLNFHSILAYEDAKLQTIHLRWDEPNRQYQVYSRSHEEDAEWQLHATGRVVPNAIPTTSPNIALSGIKEKCTEKVSSEELYQYFDRRGLKYGDHFSRIQEFWQSNDGSEFLIRIKPLHKDLKQTANQSLLHPTLLDTPIHAALKLMHGSSAVVPISINRLSFYKNTNKNSWACGKVTTTSDTTWDAELKIFSDTGELLVGIHGVKYTALPSLNDSRDDLYYRLKWVEKPFEADEIIEKPQQCLVISNGDWLIEELLSEIREDRVPHKRIGSGDCFENVSADHFKMRLDTVTDWEQLLSETNSTSITHAIFAITWQKMEPEELSQACMYLTSFVQAWVNSCGDQPLAMSLVTCQSQSVVKIDKNLDLTGSMLWGLGPLIENEHENISFRLVDLAATFSKLELQGLISDNFSNQEDREIAYRSDKRWIKKLEIANWDDQDSHKQDEKSLTTKNAVELIQSTSSGLDGLKYRETQRKAPSDSEVEVAVCATALNYKDLMKVYGQLPASVTEGTFQGSSIGMELAGEVVKVGAQVTSVKQGDQIIAPAAGSFCSFKTISDQFIMKKPETLGFSESLIYVSFLTAYYGLIEVGRLKKGEKVLIHNAAGGLGLAAVQVAQWMEAEIYATAGTDEKRAYLKTLDVAHVMDSRTLSFGDEIREFTNGEGVDVVLNALTGDALIESLSLVASYGRFIEVGKKDIAENNRIPLGAFNRNVSFASVDLDRLHIERPEIMQQLAADVYQRFVSGDFKGLPTKEFAAGEITDAFRYMGEGNHIGKIVINMDDQEIKAASHSPEQPLIDEDATYLVTGGTGGFGLEVARWLAENGAKHLVLVSRSGVVAEQSSEILTEMEGYGSEVEISSVDIGDKQQVEALIKKLGTSKSPLKGIFHGAMVLDDGFLVDMTDERYEKVLKPKADGAWYLHQSTKDMRLDYFVMFSSISSLIGNNGQANYIAANAFLDSLAHARRSEGLAATSINWGALSDVGVVARNGDVMDLLEMSGINGLSNSRALGALEQTLRKKEECQFGLFDVDWAKWSNAFPRVSDSSKFKELIENFSRSQRGAGSAYLEFKNEVVELDEDLRLEKVAESLKEHLGSILKITPEKIDPSVQISTLGIDSLMIIELILILKGDFGVGLTNREQAEDPSVEQLAHLVLGKWGLE